MSLRSAFWGCLLVLPLVGNTLAGTKAPFMVGETWWCSRGHNQCGHTGVYRYGWDFNWGSSSNSDLNRPVLASNGGRVDSVYDGTGYNNGWGRTTLVKVGTSSYDRVAHMNVVFVREGEVVVQGQVIGLCGTSGNSTGPHIHYQHQEAPGDLSVPWSFEDIGNPTGPGNCCYCNDGQHRYTSQNSNIINLRRTTSLSSRNPYGWTQSPNTVFGSLNINNTGWYHAYDPNNLYTSDGTSKNCYRVVYNNGQAAIVYDALGGARFAYCVGWGEWTIWDNLAVSCGSCPNPDGNDGGWGQGGPNSCLGMPVTNRYKSSVSPLKWRQDFQKGYIENGEIYCYGQVNGFNTYPPGWTSSGWNRQYSYLFADAYDRNGARRAVGCALQRVIVGWQGTQYNTQRYNFGSRGEGMIVYDPNSWVDLGDWPYGGANQAYYLYGNFYTAWTTNSNIGPWVLGAPTRDRAGSTQYFKYGRMVEVSGIVYAYNRSGARIWPPPGKIAVFEQFPASFTLSQNYPNPFNSQTVISYTLPEPSHVTLSVYNLLGQKIATLVDEHQPAGEHNVSWVAHELPSGIYFYRLSTDFASETKKMLLVK